MPDSAPSGVFISTKADVQIVAVVDSIDARFRCRAQDTSSDLNRCHRHVAQNAQGPSQLSGTSVRGAGCQDQTWSRSEYATIGLDEKTILLRNLLSITLTSRPVQARQDWKEKELNEWSG
jgi:hypothetical protein